MSANGSTASTNGGTEEPTVQLDALPYIDTQFQDAATRQEVDRLVEAELAKMPPSNHLERLTASEFALASDLLKSEFDRVGNGELLTFDSARYSFEPPSDEKSKNDQ